MCCFIASAMLYFFSLVPISYALEKTEKTKRYIICLIIIAFGIVNSFVITLIQNQISVDAVEKEWNKYTDYCRQEHISWSELTFPEWLSLKSSE